MAITTLTYNIDTASVTPNFEQSAGTQGDHRATGLMFVISDSLYEKLTNTLLNARLMYRFDIYDGEGGLWSSEAKELNGKNIGFELEERHTRYGGKITVYTVITALTDNGETETELYSVPVVLHLANKPDGVFKDGESYESMTSLSESAKSSAELARLNADTAATKAADAGNSANASKISSDEAALCVDKAEQLVLEAENTVNKALEPINDEMTVMASAINSLESNLSSQYYNKSEVNEAVISCVPRKRLSELGAPLDSVIAVDNSDYNVGDADGNGYGMPNDSSYHYIKVVGDMFEKNIDNYITTFENSIPKRDSRGNLFTSTPVDDEDCVNKKYVDDKIAEIPSGGGSGGTTDYELLENKPQINGVELLGNKSSTDLGIDIPTKTSNLENDSGFVDDTAFENYYTKTEVDEKTVVDQTYDKNSQSAQSGKAVAEAINEIDDKKVNKILRSDVADISEYDSTPNRIPYLYSVLENNKQSLIKSSTGIIVSELAKQYEETNPELSEKILNGIIPQEAKQYLDPHTFVMRDGNCAVPCGIHIYDKDEIGNIVNSVLYYGAAVPQGYMRAYVDEKMDTKKITSIYANYKYEFDYNALYLLKSNSGNKDIEILDGDGKNVIGYKSSYCLLILPKKTYQRTEYTATVDKKDRELDKVNCIFAGMTDKSALTTMDKIQMLQFEVDPTKKISVTPSSSGISIFKVAF